MAVGRPRKYLSQNQLETVAQAVAVSEDVVTDWFQLTSSSWKKYRYDVKTLRDLTPEEIDRAAFAQILRYGQPAFPDGLREGIFYRICLQDHNILQAMRREPDLKLMPLLVYVVTHELVHILRFYMFHQFFYADDAQKEAEETRVHQLTYQMLQPARIPELPMVFDLYARHREWFAEKTPGFDQ